jgi:hypothetical protein
MITEIRCDYQSRALKQEQRAEVGGTEAHRAGTNKYYFRYKEGLITTAIADPRRGVVHGESENKDRAMDD